jgi:hypothetical protein
MNIPELKDKEVHLWVFGDPSPPCTTRCVGIHHRRGASLIEHDASSDPHARLVDAVRARYAGELGKKLPLRRGAATEHEKMTSLRVAHVGAATLVCVTSGQALGVDIRKITRSAGEFAKLAHSLSSRTLKTIQRRAASHGFYPFAVLHAQRMAFARALNLRPHADMDRFNPLFKDTDDAYLRSSSWTRTIGGHLLRTITFGGNYVGVICCSVLTRRLVLFNTMGRGADELLAPDELPQRMMPEEYRVRVV